MFPVGQYATMMVIYLAVPFVIFEGNIKSLFKDLNLYHSGRIFMDSQC